MNLYLDLFLTFAKIGVMTFGGGVAMLPILEREVVNRKHWATNDELLDYYAIGQCTPGIIAVNVATFIGKKMKGNAGGVAATVGVVFPSFVIITVLSGLIASFSDLEIVQHAFAGIRVAVCVLVFNAVIKLAKAAVVDTPTAAIFAVVFVLSVIISVSPVVYVILAVITGILLQVKKS